MSNPYIELYDYNKAKETSENVKDADPANVEQTASILIYTIADNYGPSNVFVLENLTGLKFPNKESLYDYFSKALTIEEKDIGVLALSQLAESIKRSNPDNTIDALKEAFDGIL
jgi:hypothetical protein